MAQRKQKAEAAPVFSKAELLDAAHVFGVSREVLAGALYGVNEATREQAEALVKKFLSKGVGN